MERVLLDTDMYSELLRAKNARLVAKAMQYREKLGRFTISSVTVVEMFRGLQRAGRVSQVPDLLNSIHAEQVLSLDENAAVIAGRIYGELERTWQTIGRADPMIAGVALHRPNAGHRQHAALRADRPPRISIAAGELAIVGGSRSPRIISRIATAHQSASWETPCEAP